MIAVRCETKSLSNTAEQLKVLLCDALDRNEMDVRSERGFRDAHYIVGIALMHSAERLRMLWRHQAHLVPKCEQPTTPVVRRRASFHRNHRRFELLDRDYKLRRRELAVIENLPVLIDRAKLIATLCQIDRDKFNLAHGGLLSCSWRLDNTNSDAHHVRSEGGVHLSTRRFLGG
jgi:hypothetical protein